MLLRSELSPALVASAANVDSSGLCEAPVTTGSMLMPCRLPIPVAGTMPQSAPNTAGWAIGEWDAIGWCDAEGLAAPCADEPVLEPQAEAASATTPAITPPATWALRVRLCRVTDMVSPMLAGSVVGWVGEAQRYFGTAAAGGLERGRPRRQPS